MIDDRIESRKLHRRNSKSMLHTKSTPPVKQPSTIIEKLWTEFTSIFNPNVSEPIENLRVELPTEFSFAENSFPEAINGASTPKFNNMKIEDSLLKKSPVISKPKKRFISDLKKGGDPRLRSEARALRKASEFSFCEAKEPSHPQISVSKYAKPNNFDPLPKCLVDSAIVEDEDTGHGLLSYKIKALLGNTEDGSNVKSIKSKITLLDRLEKKKTLFEKYKHKKTSLAKDSTTAPSKENSVIKSSYGNFSGGSSNILDFNFYSDPSQRMSPKFHGKPDFGSAREQRRNRIFN